MLLLFYSFIMFVICCVLWGDNKWTKLKYILLQFIISPVWNKKTLYKSSHSEVFLIKSVLKICSKFNMFPCKFAVYFQNTFSIEHLWVAASVCKMDLFWFLLSLKLGSHRSINPDSIAKLAINQKLSPNWR